MKASAVMVLFQVVFAVWCEKMRTTSNCCAAHAKEAFLDVMVMMEESTILVIGHSKGVISEELFVASLMTLINEMRELTGPVDVVTVAAKKGEERPFMQTQGRA